MYTHLIKNRTVMRAAAPIIHEQDNDVNEQVRELFCGLADVRKQAHQVHSGVLILG